MGFSWHLKAATLGHSKAQLSVASAYTSGKGVPRDFSKAYQWYLAASSNEEALAMSRIGDFMKFGMGMQVDLEQAEEWYRKAAEKYRSEATHGNAEAQFMLAGMHEMGKGVRKDDAQAAEW